MQLDMEQLQYLSDADKQKYAALQDLFNSAGWPLLVESCQKWAVEAHHRAANATSWEQNRLNVGLRTAYESIAGQEAATHNEYIEIAESNRLKVLEASLADELEHQS